MGARDTALELIALTYDAALSPEKWLVFLDRLAKALNAGSAALREVDYASGHVPLFQTVGYDPAYVAAYRDHFVRLDYFAPKFISMPTGLVLKGDEVVPWQQQRKTEYYNDYIRAQKIRHVMGGTLAREESLNLQLNIQRKLGQSDFDEQDRRLLYYLAPHVTRAVKINRQLLEASAQKHWALSALDRLRVGVILLDGQGKPVHLNRAAERLASGDTGFAAGRGGLAVPGARDTAQLRHLIANAAASATGKPSGAVGCLQVRAAGSRGAALQFQVIPLRCVVSDQPWAQSVPGSCVAVFVAVDGARPPWGRLAAMHGLTRAEAKLAAFLSDGSSLERAAETLSVSIQTVRSQLKSVFAKTGVTRQAELVALLLRDVLGDYSDGPSGSSQ